MSAPAIRCVVCAAAMRGPRHGHYFRCPSCGFEASDLAPGLEDEQARAALDEEARRAGLQALRQRNFARILDAIEPHRRPGTPRLLDVGSAHGWFLDAAAARGYHVTGLEPDAAVVAGEGAPRHHVIPGLFPQDLPAGAAFDVISFHDVFEHLPAPGAVLQACARHLVDGGLLVLNLPNSRGALFRLAKLLAAAGLRGPLDRLWQRGFPSPHLSYFDPVNLTRLAGRHGFEPVAQLALPALERPGLWQRLRLDRRRSAVSSAFAWVALQAALPLLERLPTDAVALVYRRRESGRIAA